MISQRLAKAKSVGLLDHSSVEVVLLPDKLACHVIYGSRHVLNDDLSMVSKILEELKPDKVFILAGQQYPYLFPGRWENMHIKIRVWHPFQILN